MLYFASSYIIFRSHPPLKSVSMKAFANIIKKIVGKDFLQKQLVCHFCCRRQVANISDSVLWERSTETARQRRILWVANESETDCTPEEWLFQTASAFTHRQWPSFRDRTLWPTKATLHASKHNNMNCVCHSLGHFTHIKTDACTKMMGTHTHTHLTCM